MTAKIAVLADLGQDLYHAGDEAMGHAAADELLARGFEVLLLSRNPEQTQRLFGAGAAATLPFPWPPAEREAYLKSIREHLSGTAPLPAGDPALTLIAELQKCDGVVIAGGGNLNSRYGWLLHERAAVVAVARSLGKPVVISGQTLGPQLTGVDAGILADMFEAANLCSVRERSSAELCRRLGVRAVSGLDDASFLAFGGGTAGREAGRDASGLNLPEAGYVAVTVAPHSGDPENFHELLGVQLDALHARTGLATVFLPHFGVGTEDSCDRETHARIAACMSSPRRQLPVLPARDVAAVTAGASLVATTRYHPAVFALSSAVPVAALTKDNYSGARLAGVMANWGLADFVVPLPALSDGTLAEALAETWQRREEISAHLAVLQPSRKAWFTQWWDGVAAVLSGSKDASAAVEELAPARALRAAGPWHAAVQEVAAGFHGRSAVTAQTDVEEDRLRSYAVQRDRELEALQAEHQRLLNSRTVKAALSAHRLYAKILRR